MLQNVYNLVLYRLSTTEAELIRAGMWSLISLLWPAGWRHCSTVHGKMDPREERGGGGSWHRSGLTAMQLLKRNSGEKLGGQFVPRKRIQDSMHFSIAHLQQGDVCKDGGYWPGMLAACQGHARCYSDE